MRKSVIAGLALWAALAGKARAYVDYPWCVMGETRGFECVFTSREQCAQDGRNRGFGGQCVQNPAYKPGKPTVSGPARKRMVSQTPRPSQAVSGAHQQAMEECKARYPLSTSEAFPARWGLIEACFKEKTGMYPSQANANCLPERC